MHPDHDRDPVDTLLIRGGRVDLVDDRGRTLEICGRDRELLLGEAAAARALYLWERAYGWRPRVGWPS